MGNQKSQHQKTTSQYPMPKQRTDAQRIDEARARNLTDRHFMSNGLILGHSKGRMLWDAIRQEKPYKVRLERAMNEMGQYADVCTVVYPQWSVDQLLVDFPIPLAADEETVTSTMIGNWVFLANWLAENSCRLEEQGHIHRLIRDACAQELGAAPDVRESRAT